MHTLDGYPNQHSDFKSQVSAKGLEPLTNGLKGRCSTIELRAHLWDGMILSRPLRPASIKITGRNPPTGMFNLFIDF